MRVLAIDPGASAGFCYSEGGVLQSVGNSIGVGLTANLDELVVEDQYAATHIYRNGKRVRVSRKSQQTLSFTAGRLFERYEATRKYRIPVEAWRRILWPGAVRLTKKVVLARLRTDYGHLVEHVRPVKAQADVLEAIGINVAWCRLTAAQKEKYRAE